MAGKLLLMCCAVVILANLAAGCRPVVKEEGRTSWPELVGKTGAEAKATIEEENPSLQVVIVPYGSVVTADYRTDRVRIYVDVEGIVVETPRIG